MLQPTNLQKYILPHLVSCRILASCAENAWFVNWRSMVFVAYRTKSVGREQLRFQRFCVRAARSEVSLCGLFANSSSAAKALLPSTGEPEICVPSSYSVSGGARMIVLSVDVSLEAFPLRQGYSPHFGNSGEVEGGNSQRTAGKSRLGSARSPREAISWRR